MLKRICYILLCPLLMVGCAIENDIPYPLVEGNIEYFEVEGQCAGPNGSSQATINTTSRTVSLYVDDSVDLSKLRITRFNVTSDAEIWADSAACADYALFPKTGFTQPSNVADTRVDFRNPVQFTLRTYQDYLWTVSVTQLIEREINVDGMVDYVVDADSRQVIIYMPSGTDLTNLQVHTMNLGGPHGQVLPDPTAVHDFSSPLTFNVSYGWEEVFREWTVYVYCDENEDGSRVTSSVFPMTTRAFVSGTLQSGKTPVIEYKTSSASAWEELPASAVSVNGIRFEAELDGLNASTSYNYRVNVDNVNGQTQTFTTAPATPLPNGGFETWSSEPAGSKTLWKPWSDGLVDSDFWDTGNKGATIVGNSNSIPTTETCNGSGRAALLQSTFVALKLAAGNIFAGKYVRTDGTDGVLNFGRPFTAFPSSLRFYYKYTTGPINRVRDEELENLRNRPDSCHIYIALSDNAEPFEIRTNVANRQLFDKNDANVIAYGEFISGQSTSEYQEMEIKLDYRATNRTPKYLVLVATASKYGDYFVGSDQATLWLDEMELVYE